MSEKEVKEVKPEPKSIRAVYGMMVDPHTNEVFQTTAKPVGKITEWVKCQLDAGKLALE